MVSISGYDQGESNDLWVIFYHSHSVLTKTRSQIGPPLLGDGKPGSYEFTMGTEGTVPIENGIPSGKPNK